MALGDKVQKGQAWKVEFGSYAYTGYEPESATLKFTADDEGVKDSRGAVITHIYTNPAQVLDQTLMIKSTGSITPPKPGDTITLTPPQGTSTKYLVKDAGVTFSSGTSKLQMSLVREDSMQTAIDA